MNISFDVSATGRFHVESCVGFFLSSVSGQLPEKQLMLSESGGALSEQWIADAKLTHS